jgi:hypothetical protein
MLVKIDGITELQWTPKSRFGRQFPENTKRWAGNSFDFFQGTRIHMNSSHFESIVLFF